MRLNAVLSFVLTWGALIVATLGLLAGEDVLFPVAGVCGLISITYAILAVGDVLSERRT